MKEIIGHRILAILIDKNEQHYLQFVTDKKTIVYEAEGDCCSESWFADLIGINFLLGEIVIKCEEIEMDEVEDERTRQEYDQLYCIKLTTTKGNTDIVFRNSSNGYYGGWLSLQKSVPPETEFLSILSDYSV